MKELKRSAYCNDLTATVIGSRQELRAQAGFKTMGNVEITHNCKKSVQKGLCDYYTKLMKRETIKNEPDFTKNVMDIEDLMRAGVKHECCPYYLAKARAELAKVIFMPYDVSAFRIAHLFIYNSIDFPSNL